MIKPIKRKKMTPAQFMEIRLKLGLTHWNLATLWRLGSDPSLGRKAISMIENGHNKRGIDGRTQALMEAYRDGYRPKGVTFPCDEKKETK